MNENLKKYKLSLITVFLIAVSFGFGVNYGKSEQNLNYKEPAFDKTLQISSTTADMNAFWTTWKLLDQKFVYTHKDTKKINDSDKLWGAIAGLTASYGDPYTVFLPPQDAQIFQEDISGEFSGVGMELGTKDGQLVVVAPLKSSPAERAGIRSGDAVLGVDGKSTDGMAVDDAVKLI